MTNFDSILAGATVSPAVFEQHPDYAAVLITVLGLEVGASQLNTDALLAAAESKTAELLAQASLEDLPQVKVWREKFASMGLKPRDARSSFEALMRRAEGGLPRIDPLTDLYNAVSVSYQIPVGGEDLDRYFGSPQLVVADGTETFDARENGELVLVHPAPGEIVWRDDQGVTCRRWNWRQCVRTRITPETRNALFIFDGAGPDSVGLAEAAAAEFVTHLQQLWPMAVIEQRTISLA